MFTRVLVSIKDPTTRTTQVVGGVFVKTASYWLNSAL